MESIWNQHAQNELIYDKCKPINVEKYKTVNTETPMHWDRNMKMYPFNSVTKDTTQVSDLVVFHTNTFPICASLDGINTDASSDLYEEC